MLYTPIGGTNVTKLLTARDDVPATAGDPFDGGISYVRHSAGGTAAGFPIAQSVTMPRNGDDDPFNVVFVQAAGAYRVTSAITRSDASSATFFQHQVRFLRFALSPDFLPAFDSVAESPNNLTGVISGLTPAVTWVGWLDAFDGIGQAVNHNAPGTIDVRGSVTIEYLGHPGTAVDPSAGPWGPPGASSYPGPGGITYGPP